MLIECRLSSPLRPHCCVIELNEGFIAHQAEQSQSLARILELWASRFPTRLRDVKHILSSTIGPISLGRPPTRDQHHPKASADELGGVRGAAPQLESPVLFSTCGQLGLRPTMTVLLAMRIFSGVQEEILTWSGMNV